MDGLSILAAAAVAITAIICLTAARAWSGWLGLRRLELAVKNEPAEQTSDETGVRIELASVRERLKKLEAIASGVDP